MDEAEVSVVESFVNLLNNDDVQAEELENFLSSLSEDAMDKLSQVLLIIDSKRALEFIGE